MMPVFCHNGQVRDGHNGTIKALDAGVKSGQAGVVAWPTMPG